MVDKSQLVVKTSAWHFKFQRWIGINVYYRTDLCSYIRGFFFAVWKLQILVTTLPLLLLWLNWLGWDINTINDAPVEVRPLMFLPLFYFLITIPLQALYGIGMIHSWLNDNVVSYHVWLKNRAKKKEARELRKPNIFIEWLKAKKDKICPLLKFE